MIYNKITKRPDNKIRKGDVILTASEMEISQWEGYERRDFKLDGHECILIMRTGRFWKRAGILPI